MNRHFPFVASCISLLLACATALFAQGAAVERPADPWGVYVPSANFSMFMMTLTQLNMTPDLTLDKETKQKLQDLRDEFTKAQNKYWAEQRERLQDLSKEQMEAYKAKDQEKIKQLTEKYREIYSGGPSNAEFLARARAALQPDQLKFVDEKIQKQEEERKAQAEKWRRQYEASTRPAEKK